MRQLKVFSFVLKNLGGCARLCESGFEMMHTKGRKGMHVNIPDKATIGASHLSTSNYQLDPLDGWAGHISVG